MQDLYAGNNKTLLKEINEDPNNQKDDQCIDIEEDNIVYVAIFPKLIRRFNAILS